MSKSKLPCDGSYRNGAPLNERVAAGAPERLTTVKRLLLAPRLESKFVLLSVSIPAEMVDKERL